MRPIKSLSSTGLGLSCQRATISPNTALATRLIHVCVCVSERERERERECLLLSRDRTCSLQVWELFHRCCFGHGGAVTCLFHVSGGLKSEERRSVTAEANSTQCAGDSSVQRLESPDTDPGFSIQAWLFVCPWNASDYPCVTEFWMLSVQHLFCGAFSLGLT